MNSKIMLISGSQARLHLASHFYCQFFVIFNNDYSFEDITLILLPVPIKCGSEDN